MKQKLDLKEIQDFFAPDNKLASFFANYEYRPQQQKMAEKITETFNQKQHLLVEAGTGTGKSLAYLLPSILLALMEEEQVVISTNTINLQEQLIKKDIPLLQQVLDLDFKPVLVKGRRNYICLRRLIQYEKTAQLTTEEYQVLSNINQWVLETQTGCRSDLDFRVDFNLWRNICSESDLCLRGNCPYYEQCHFMFAREEAQEADILVVNHHLLFADLSLRKDRDLEDEVAVLPPYKKVVFDEAHNIEEVATSYLGSRVSRQGIIKFLESLYNHKEGIGVLLQARVATSELETKFKKRLQQKIDNEMIPLVRKLIEGTQNLFNRLIAFINNKIKGREQKLRLTKENRQEELWQQSITVEFENLLFNLNKIGKNLSDLLENLITYEDDIENFEALKVEIKSTLDFILQTGESIAEIVNYPEEDYVYWLECKEENCSLHSAPLDIAQELKENLLEKMDSVILTSATLTVDNSFDFIKENLGLNDYPVETLEVGSPFDYQNQLRVGVVNDFPQPNQSNFIETVISGVKNIVQATQGRTLVLFTSYGMLNQVYYKLKRELEELDINNLYRQGMKSRQYLINEFKANDKSVLLGTDSFWEGVDIPGDELSCVVIVKLPFAVPSEPVIAAKIEKLKANGDNSFFKYMVPKAVIKFKQGFGRLIRTSQDKGWVVIFDKRLTTKSYGNIFLKSLPTDSQILINNLDRLIEKIKNYL